MKASNLGARERPLSIGEDPLTIATTAMLRVALSDAVMWTHHPNNFMPIDHSDPKQRARQARHAIRMHKMGMRTGWPDYDFIWVGRAYFIEMKDRGSLSKEQRDFRDWCHQTRTPWALCRSTEAVWTTLYDWGLPIRRIAF